MGATAVPGEQAERSVSLRLERVALAAAIVGFLLIAGYFSIWGRINQDEGWYLYAGHLAYEGELPYRDFPYFQAPLLPYVFGLPQLLFATVP